MLLRKEGVMEKYYCYFELCFDTNDSNTAFLGHSMGCIPLRLAHNSDKLLSYLLLFYIIKHKYINIEDIVFIAKNGLAWQLIEENSDFFLITDDGCTSVGIYDQTGFPILEFALIDYQKIYIKEIKIIDQIHFECLKDMYEPNFDLTG